MAALLSKNTTSIIVLPQLCILVLGLFQIACDLFDDICEVLAVQIVVCLEKHFSQSAFTNGIIFSVELIETVEGISVSVDIQHIHGQVVSCQIHRLKK